MATIQDLERAMNSLRAEIATIVAPHVAASITGLRNEFSGSVAAALAELRHHSETTAQQVSDTVDSRFQHASQGFSDEQGLMRGQIQAGQVRITATQAEIEKTLGTLKTNVDAAVGKMAAVSDGKLEEVASQLIGQEDKVTGFAVAMASYEADQANNIEVIHGIMSVEVRTMHGDVTQLDTTMNHRMGHVEHIVQQQMMNSPVDGSRQSPGGARGYQICVPDPKSWNLTVLKNGETGFLPWRK